EADAVVILPVEQLPAGAVVEGSVGAGGADRDPAVFRPGHGGAVGEPLLQRCPGLAAVGGDRRVYTKVLGLAVVPAHDHAVPLVGECDRENPGGLGAGDDRRIAHLPVFAPVPGMNPPGRLGPAGREPDVPVAVGDEAGAAGG